MSIKASLSQSLSYARIIVCLAFCFSLFPAAAPAGAGVVQEWVAHYAGDLNAAVNTGGLAVDAAGNVYVTGYAFTDIASFQTVWATVKYQSGGQQEWVRPYGGAFGDAAGHLAVDGDGNVWVTGGLFSQSPTATMDMGTIKYDKNGTIIREERYHDNIFVWNVQKGLVIDKNGNAIVTAFSTSWGRENDLYHQVP